VFKTKCVKIPAAWITDERIKNEFRTLVYLAALCAKSKTGSCYLGDDIIAEELGEEKERVAQILEKLKELGYIELQTAKSEAIIARRITIKF
jgi:hypothetical protein